MHSITRTWGGQILVPSDSSRFRSTDSSSTLVGSSSESRALAERSLVESTTAGRRGVIKYVSALNMAVGLSLENKFD